MHLFEDKDSTDIKNAQQLTTKITLSV